MPNGIGMDAKCEEMLLFALCVGPRAGITAATAHYHHCDLWIFVSRPRT